MFPKLDSLYHREAQISGIGCSQVEIVQLKRRQTTLLTLICQWQCLPRSQMVLLWLLRTTKNSGCWTPGGCPALSKFRKPDQEPTFSMSSLIVLMCAAVCSDGSLVELEDSTIGAPIRAVAFDPNRKLLLAGGDDKTLRVWQLDSRRLLHRWYVQGSPSSMPQSALEAAEGSKLAALP